MKKKIALVGNAPQEKYEMLNALLDEESVIEMCDIELYGADGQPDNEALTDAIEDYRDNAIDGIVCLPFTTKAITKMIPVMPIQIHATGRLASVKGKVSKNEAATTLKQEEIVTRATTLAKALKRDLSILNPRIAILSLNDDIVVEEGSAEVSAIAPAVSELVKSGIQAFGPIASGKFFDNNDLSAFDAILQMYDGQCNEAFANASNEGIVTLLTDYEAPITQAEPEQLLQALSLVTDVTLNRKVYDEPFTNPLPKLYHEKREDGDKARFAIKKGFNPAEHRRENVTYIKNDNA